MFKSIRNTLRNRVIQDNAICYLIGFMIGIGGFAEATLVGMGIYILIALSRPLKEPSLLPWAKDIGVVTVGVLLLVYWSYVDPHSLTSGVEPGFCPINSDEALSSTEVLKIIGTTIFGISCNHSQLKRLRKLCCGVAVGLSMYVIPTVIGSIIMQGVRGGGDKIFDIFSGNISAQSTTAGYLIIIMIGILSTLKKHRLLMVSIGLAFITGVQTSNRSVILFGFLGCIIEFINWPISKPSAPKHYMGVGNRKKLLFLFGILIIAVLTLISRSQFIYPRITSALDGRMELYLEGYSRLIRYLLNPTYNLLADSQLIQGAGWELWWHSVPLDAARAGNLSGAYLSLTWLTMLIIGLLVCIRRRNLSLLLLSFTLLFIYMTGMPLAAGAYQFVALYCGYLLLSNELVANPTQT